MAGEIRDAQERGEVARQNRHPGSVRTSDTVPATLDSLNLDRRRVAEWRDTAEAGEVVVERAIQGALDEGRAAQERGEVARKEDGRPVSARSTGTSTPVTASAPKPAKLSELGLDSRRLSEWRRTAEAAKPTCPIPAVFSPVERLRPFPAATYCQRAAARPGGSWAASCASWTRCCITVDANELMLPLRKRMPVVLDRADIDRWLRPIRTSRS